MRGIVISFSLALLAACGGAATNMTNGSNDAAPAANAAAPEADANGAKPETAAAPAAATGDPRRAGEIQECIADVRPEVPEGTDLNAFCGCAVDRMQGGGGERAAMEACATEMGIEPRH